MMRSLVALLSVLLLAAPASAASLPIEWMLDIEGGITRNEDADDDSVYARITYQSPNLELSLQARQEDYTSLIPFCGLCYLTEDAEGTRLRFDASYMFWKNHGPSFAYENEPNHDDRWEIGWRMRIGPMN